MLAYPDGSRVVAGAHIHTAQTLARIFEDSLISLISAGLDQRTAAYTMMTAIYYTFGSAIEEQSAPTAETTASLNAAGFYAAYPILRARSTSTTRALMLPTGHTLLGLT